MTLQSTSSDSCSLNREEICLVCLDCPIPSVPALSIVEKEPPSHETQDSHDLNVANQAAPCLHFTGLQAYNLRVTATGMVTCCRRGTNGFTLQLYGLGWGLGCSLFCMRDFSGESTILRKHHFIWWKDRLLSFFHSVCSQAAEGKLLLLKMVKFIGKHTGMLLETHKTS